jgi:ApbE family
LRRLGTSACEGLTSFSHSRLMAARALWDHWAGRPRAKERKGEPSWTQTAIPLRATCCRRGSLDRRRPPRGGCDFRSRVSRLRTAGRARRDGVRHVRRMSNWTAAALVAGTGAAAVALAHHAFPVSAPAASAASATGIGGNEWGGRAAGVSLGRHDQRVGCGCDHPNQDRERQDCRHPGPAHRPLPRLLMGIPVPALTALPPLWQRVSTGDATVAVAERAALGTNARVAVWPPDNLDGALAAVDGVLGALNRQASRFRQDSEISRIYRGGGGLFLLSDGLAEAIGVALEAARWTRGLTDPTVGQALISLGCDRDFAAIDPARHDPAGPPPPAPVAGRCPPRSGRHRQGPGRIRSCAHGSRGQRLARHGLGRHCSLR